MLLFTNAPNTAGMVESTSSLAVSCEDSSMIGTVTAASEQWSAEGSLPSSLRAALSFISGHPTLSAHEQMPMSAQRCLPSSLRTALNFGCTGAKENPIVIEDEQDEEKSFNYVEKYTNYVYKRRKLQGNSVSLLPKPAAGKDCLPHDMLNSAWLSQPAQVENFPKCREDLKHCDASMSTCNRGYSGNVLLPGKKQINCNSGMLLDGEMYNTSAKMHVDYKAPNSEEISLYHTGSSGLIVDEGKTNLNIVQVGEASSGNRSVIEDSGLQAQSSSSSGMSNCNLEQTTVSFKDELTELAECTSSVVAIHQSQDSDLEKDWCVSVLKQYGLLRHYTHSREYAAVGHMGVVGDGSCPQLCKICGSLENSTTLICDLCDETFHMSCCNPKIKSTPTQDDWYCQFCKKKRKKPGKKSLTEKKGGHKAVKDTCTHFDKATQYKGDLFSRMLENSEPYTTQVRIGKAFQADVPDYQMTNGPNDAEMLYLGEPLAKEFEEQNLINEPWSKGWQPAKSFLPGSMENWLQCQNVTCMDGTYSDDEKPKDIICGKWRRAPLSQVQNGEWDCSCAVVWDPVHADCAVPQELKTEEIMMRLKATEMAKPPLVYKKRKSKMKHCMAEGGSNQD